MEKLHSGKKWEKKEVLRMIKSTLDADPTSLTFDTAKAVLKSCADPSETIRELAIDLIMAFQKQTDLIKFGYLIPALLTVIVAKQEPSEVIRFKMAQCCAEQLVLEACDLRPLSGDILFLATSLLNDTFDEVIYTACDIIHALGRRISLQTMSKMIIQSTIPLFGHRKSKVVEKAITLARYLLVSHRGHEAIQQLAGFREHNVVPLEWWFGTELRVNVFATLSRHDSFGVRYAFYSMLSGIWQDMVEKYDYETLLMPYIVSGLGDDSADIRKLSMHTLEAAGTMYEHDYKSKHEEELFFSRDLERLLCHHLCGVEYPLPFLGRPRLGSRILVQKQFLRVLKAILNELTDWKAQCRQKAASLMRNMILYSEDACTERCEEILRAIKKAVSLTEEPEICATLFNCAKWLGLFVNPDIWWNFFKNLPESDDASRHMLKLMMAQGAIRLGKLKDEMCEWLGDKNTFIHYPWTMTGLKEDDPHCRLMLMMFKTKNKKQIQKLPSCSGDSELLTESRV